MESITWLGIALVVTAYARQRVAEVKKPTLLPTPRNEDEVDPTRWRHDGSQPTTSRNGNGASNEVQAVSALSHALAL